MDLKQLHYFVTIAEEGSISAAARKLYMSQPPLSSQIKQLEKDLGCSLLERGPRSIRLTKAGETLYSYGKSLLDLSNVAREETISAARLNNGTIRMGIVSSVMGSEVLNWIQNFAREFPEVHFDLVEGNTYELLSKFQNNSIHMAILRTPFNREKLECHTLFTDGLVAIASDKYFNASEDITLKELTEYPLVIYRRWEEILRNSFKAKDLVPDFYCINDDARTTLHFAEAGLGIGIMPKSAVSMHSGHGFCRSISDCEILSDVVLAWQADSYIPTCTKNFMDYIKNHGTSR